MYFKTMMPLQTYSKPLFLALFFLISASSVLSQTIVKRLTACIDEDKTIAKSDFPCANAASNLIPTNVVAVKRLANGSLQMQFAQTGEVTVSCNCPNGATESIKIAVTNCDSIKCMGNNLVPNGGFESFANCLTVFSRNLSLTSIVLPWFDYTGLSATGGSSDYYNANCPYSVANAFGTPFLNANRARTGSGFFGQYCYISPPFLREYAAVPLSTPLSIGKRYRIRFYTKPSATTTQSTYAKIDRIGLSLSTQNPRTTTLKTVSTATGNTNDYVGNKPVILTPSGTPVGDTTFWTRLETIFTADSAYSFLTLGGLTKISEMQLFGNSVAGYYFFDDVSIHELDLPPDTTRLRDSLTCFVRDTGLIKRKLVNRYGCDSLVLQKVVLANAINISLGRDTTLPNGLRFTIPTRISGDSVAKITWIPPTGLSCADCLKPQFVVSEKTVVYIANVIGRNGCKAADTLQIDKSELPFVYVPTAFSPNNDGKNEVLVVYGSLERVKSIARFSVYNRWGGLVFEKHDFPPNDEAFGWKGEGHGQDVYVYLVEIELFDGQKVVVSGDTTLMR
jgi:hypothetical protein